MSEETAAAKAEEKKVLIYDAAARNRFVFEVLDGGQKYEMPETFEALDDERYLKWVHDLDVKGTPDNVDDHSLEATVALWDDIIADVENIEVPADADFKALIEPAEKKQAINQLLTVAIVEPEAAQNGKRRLGMGEKTTQTIKTECWFNGEIVEQEHELLTKSIEFEKRYERLQSKRTKTERIGGLRRQPKTEYVPQDAGIGKLYDAMFVSQKGFANGVIPLRFKTLVMNYIFAPSLSPKTVGK